MMKPCSCRIHIILESILYTLKSCQSSTRMMTMTVALVVVIGVVEVVVVAVVSRWTGVFSLAVSCVAVRLKVGSICFFPLHRCDVFLLGEASDVFTTLASGLCQSWWCEGLLVVSKMWCNCCQMYLAQTLLV